MDQRLKNILGGAGVIALVALSYAGVAFVKAYSSSIQPGSYRSFSVSGQGKAVVVPDVAQISFTVITDGGKDITAIQKENTDKTNDAIAFVRSQGVDGKDIRTASWNLQPKYQSYRCDRVVPQPLLYPQNDQTIVSPSPTPAPCPPPEIVGYTLTQSVEVKVRDFAKVGEILSGVTGAGANRVSGPMFTLDDPFAAQNEARTEAIRKARENAESVARAGGFTVGRLLDISEGGYPGPYYDRFAYGMGGEMKAVSAEAPPVPIIEPGSQDVTVTVMLRYEIR